MFGRPTIAMSGSEDGMKSSLSFCTIAHQSVLDLSCLPVIYSRIIETDRTFENQVIGSVRGLYFFGFRGRLPIFYLVVLSKEQVKKYA